MHRASPKIRKNRPGFITKLLFKVLKVNRAPIEPRRSSTNARARRGAHMGGGAVGGGERFWGAGDGDGDGDEGKEDFDEDSDSEDSDDDKTKVAGEDVKTKVGGDDGKAEVVGDDRRVKKRSGAPPTQFFIIFM